MGYAEVPALLLHLRDKRRSVGGHHCVHRRRSRCCYGGIVGGYLWSLDGLCNSVSRPDHIIWLFDTDEVEVLRDDHWSHRFSAILYGDDRWPEYRRRSGGPSRWPGRGVHLSART